MKRTVPLRANLDTTRAWKQRAARPLPAQSERKASESEARRVVRLQVLARDRACQLAALGAGVYAVPDCIGGVTVHHRRKAAQGGGYTVANLVRMCAGCNDALEADADWARWAHSVGLVVRQGDPEWASLG